MPKNKTRVILDNEERWKLAKNITNMGFYDWYPQEDRIIWDEVLHRITGLSTQSKKRRQEYFISVVHPEDVEGVVKDMDRILDPSIPQSHFEHSFRVLIKGQPRYMLTSGIREIDKSGLVSKVFGMVIDTTSKVEAELRIRENEERLRIASKATGFGTFDFLVPENSLFWDNRMHEIFGLSTKSKADRNEYFFKCIHPVDKVRVAENYGRRMSSLSEETSAFDEFRIIVKGE